MPPTPTKTKPLGRPLLPSWLSVKIAPRLRRPIPPHSESESRVLADCHQSQVADLQSSSGIDFPGMSGEPADRDTRLHPVRFVVRRVAYIVVSILLPLTKSGY